MLRLWADHLPLTMAAAFYIGSVYTSAVASSSFLSADTVTIYTISVSEASEGTATDLPPSVSVGLSAVGTLSDGSTTTYLEEGEFQSTILGDVTTMAPGSTTTAILIEGASGYQLLESSSDSWKDIQCSFDGSSNGGCVESAGIISSDVISSSGTEPDTIISKSAGSL